MSDEKQTGRAMGRPRCDPFDATAIVAAIGKGETTPLRAYQAYASTAARPYARASFETYLRRHERLGRSPEPPPTVRPAPHAIDAAADAESDAFWGARLAVKSRVVTTEADNASLTVKGGSLFVHDGDRRLRYDAGARMPAAIVMAGWGGFLSVEALRFCASHRIAVVVLDWMRDLLSVMPGAPRASAAMLRAQALADPAWIASRVVLAKIENAVRAGALARNEAMRFIDAARRATTVQEAMIAEAQAARVSWSDSAPKLQWRAGSPRVPPAWKEPVLARQRADLRVKRYATHPVNAMLNAVFSVTAGRLAAALQAAGAHPAIGFLHADKLGQMVSRMGRDRAAEAFNRGQLIHLHPPASIQWWRFYPGPRLARKHPPWEQPVARRHCRMCSFAHTFERRGRMDG